MNFDFNFALFECGYFSSSPVKSFNFSILGFHTGNADEIKWLFSLYWSKKSLVCFYLFNHEFVIREWSDYE
jgi:hypothetical protein